MRWTPVVLALSVALESASAQVVRGTITERASGLPMRGVLISAAMVPTPAGPDSVRRTLTNARGEYALRLPSGGRYIVSAKSIGVTRYSSDVTTLREGETRRIDMALDRFEQRLPTVNVVDYNLCFRRNDQRRQIVALWDEVRTALLATGVSREEQLVPGVLSKYMRTLEPRSLRILEDRRTVFEGLFERPMRSLSGDSLAKAGFWHAQDRDTLVFYGPDDEALLSVAFSAAHCFELISGRDALRGLVGLGFQPRRPNAKGGIEGTIWIDAGNFELRYVQFRYTNLITLPSNPHLGGQVHFERHPSGAWLVRRWFIRMPLFTKAVTYRPTVWRLLEEGGGLYSPGLRSWEAPGTITGVVTDSMGQLPLRGTVVALSGTPLSAEVDSLGRFRFDSIPPGAYTLLASHGTYADFGQMVDDEPLTLEAGKEYRAHLRAITTTQLRSMLCDVVRTDPPFGTTVTSTADQAIVRVLMSFADSGGFISRFPIWLRWRDPEQKEQPRNPVTTVLPERLVGREFVTDDAGGATFCGVPADTPLELLMLRSDDDPSFPEGGRAVRISSFILKKGEIALRSFTVRPPR